MTSTVGRADASPRLLVKRRSAAPSGQNLAKATRACGPAYDRKQTLSAWGGGGGQTLRLRFDVHKANVA